MILVVRIGHAWMLEKLTLALYTALVPSSSFSLLLLFVALADVILRIAPPRLVFLAHLDKLEDKLVLSTYAFSSSTSDPSSSWALSVSECFDDSDGCRRRSPLVSVPLQFLQRHSFTEFQRLFLEAKSMKTISSSRAEKDLDG